MLAFIFKVNVEILSNFERLGSFFISLFGLLDELLHLALGGVGPQGPQHLPNLGHLQDGSRVNKVRSPPP